MLDHLCAVTALFICDEVHSSRRRRMPGARVKRATQSLRSDGKACRHPRLGLL
jgi:hypothetical protein